MKCQTIFTFVIFYLCSFSVATKENQISRQQSRLGPIPDDLRRDGRTGREYDMHPAVYRCGEEGQETTVNFINENFPLPDRGVNMCLFRLKITNKNVCQVRVDFVQNQLITPTEGECVDQYLKIEGTIWPLGIPNICGNNSHLGQHVYVHVDQNFPTVYVDFLLTTLTPNSEYLLGLWITQLDCTENSPLEAPKGCVQYYLKASDYVHSFNYVGGQYLNNQNYKVCIRMTRTTCAIRYKAAQGDFMLEKQGLNRRNQISRAGIGTSSCQRDYILIPGGTETLETESRTEDRYCGGTFSASSAHNGPSPVFTLVHENLATFYVKTGTKPLRYNSEAHSPGFRLHYQQMGNCLQRSGIGHPLIVNYTTIGDFDLAKTASDGLESYSYQ